MDPSSPIDTVVACVAVEFDRRENLARLPSVVTLVAYVDARLEDFDRREPLMEPPNGSPFFTEPGRELNKFREMASRPNIVTFEREADGVDGRELLPVPNLKRPY